jgi:hypothetical protein
VSDERGKAQAIVDVTKNEIVKTLHFDSETGMPQYDPVARRVYVNLQDQNIFAVIDPVTDNGAVSTNILHFRARVLGVYGQGLFHGQPLTPETVSAVSSSDRMVRFSWPSPPTHTGPRGLRSQGTVSSRWSRDCVE